MKELRNDPWVKEKPDLLKKLKGVGRFLDATPPSVIGILPPLTDEAAKTGQLDQVVQRLGNEDAPMECKEVAPVNNRRKNKNPREITLLTDEGILPLHTDGVAKHSTDSVKNVKSAVDVQNTAETVEDSLVGDGKNLDS